MHLEPELHDEVELLEDETQGGWTVFKGQKGIVGYASYTGWFLVRFHQDKDPPDYRFEQRHLGVKLRISRPRRGHRKNELEIASYKDRA